jgi:hypothetical protein
MGKTAVNVAQRHIVVAVARITPLLLEGAGIIFITYGSQTSAGIMSFHLLLYLLQLGYLV